mmetsp:Transcript_3000/g.6355  ORF Transcript_3000/g.6355 Transcript_3000/m.6355 type:complete len:411 (-) Transcript_3000:807-2039(-)
MPLLNKVEVGIGRLTLLFACLRRGLFLALVVPMGSQSKLGHLMHIPRSNLNLQTPVLVAVHGPRRVVKTLVAVRFGVLDIILEARIESLGLPSIRAESLGVVAKSPFPGTNGFRGLLLRHWLGVEYNTERNGIGHFPNVLVSVFHHFAPHAVGFLDAGRHGKVLDETRKLFVALQHGRHFLLHVVENLIHGFLCRGSVGSYAFRSKGQNLLVLAFVQDLERRSFEFVFQPMHSEPTGNGRINPERFSSHSHLFRVQPIHVLRVQETSQTVQTGCRSNRQCSPVLGLGQQHHAQILRIGLRRLLLLFHHARRQQFEFLESGRVPRNLRHLIAKRGHVAILRQHQRFLFPCRDATAIVKGGSDQSFQSQVHGFQQHDAKFGGAGNLLPIARRGFFNGKEQLERFVFGKVRLL